MNVGDAHLEHSVAGPARAHSGASEPPGGAGRGTDSKAFIYGTALLLVATAAVYFPVILADFAWDDQGQILDNAANLSLSHVPGYFVSDVWSMTEQENIHRPPYYRPLFLASLAVDHALFGLSPRGYHLHSLLWHLAATASLLAFLRRVLPRFPALFGAAVFALHPVQSESVCWISGRADPMAACFTFLALWALAPRTPGPGRQVAGALAMAGALFSKEPAVVAPVLLAGVDLARFGRPGPVRRYAGLVAVTMAWAGLHLYAAANTGLPPGRLGHLWPKLLDVLGLYGRLLVWPYPLTTGRHLLYLSPPWWATVAGIAAMLGLSAWLISRGGKPATAGLAFALLAFLPSLYAMAGSYQLGERYLYLPLAGVALAAGAASQGIRPARAAWGLPLLLASLWAIQDRLPDWQDGLSLTESEVRVAPNPYTWGGYGLELAARGRWEEALPWLRQALDATPPDQAVCTESVRAALLTGRRREASALAIQTRRQRCHPTYELVLLHGLAFARSGQWEDVAKATRFLEKQHEDDRWMPLGAALALVRGNLAQYRDLTRRSGEGGKRFREMVTLFLKEGGRPDLVPLVSSALENGGVGPGDLPARPLPIDVGGEMGNGE